MEHLQPQSWFDYCGNPDREHNRGGIAEIFAILAANAFILAVVLKLTGYL